MMAARPDPESERGGLEGRVRLEDLVDRDGLGELVRSCHALFGLPVRIYSADGTLLADASEAQDVCAYVAGLPQASAACARTVRAARSADPGPDGSALVPCFTGAVYRVFPIEYDGRRVGKCILGPCLPHDLGAAPDSLGAVDSGIDASVAAEKLLRMPRARAGTIDKIAAHLRRALDLILHSGHKAQLVSAMHLLSVRESYRELEEKRARLQEAYDRLKELDRLKSNFLGTVSHELRTPLTSIIGYSEMLAEGLAGPLSPEQKEFAQTIQEKGEQLLSLIMSLLDLSKLESGTMSLRRRPLVVGDLLASVASTLAPAARKKRVTIACEVRSDLPGILADAERLRQVFVNLLDNAVKFSPEGGTVRLVAVPARAEVAADEGGLVVLAPARGAVEVRVVDQGIGIPEEERARVFDAFYQVDSSSTREHGGSGLGLAIVKRLVEAHGGTVRVEGGEPSGAEFVVTLPVESAAATAA